MILVLAKAFLALLLLLLLLFPLAEGCMRLGALYERGVWVLATGFMMLWTNRFYLSNALRLFIPSLSLSLYCGMAV